MSKVIIDLPAAQLKRLRELAETEGVSLDEMIRRMTAAALTAHEVREDFRSAARRGDPDKALAALESLNDSGTNPTA